jgi:hypothetical protein
MPQNSPACTSWTASHTFDFGGIYPESDPGKRSVSIAQARQIPRQPNRLPAVLANCLYREGESGMGYAVFTVEYKEGTRQTYVTGNAVDFIVPPAGLCASRDHCIGAAGFAAVSEINK